MPIVSAVLILLGPFVLLRFPRYSTVLDGATFGGASAVSFVGAEVIVQAIPIFGDGLRPIGSVGPWLAKLATIAIAVPLLTMAVMAAASGALWLRYRAPVRDRRALGRFGRPELAIPLAIAFLVAASIVQIKLSIYLSLAVVVVLALGGLVWLRQVIHVGLLEEALEIEAAPTIVCANCGHKTRMGGFCENCGIALAALPQSRVSVAAGGA
jgi:hypothetical protein